jgi:uncharacterized membrane protein YoaK (UPF0700 family)
MSGIRKRPESLVVGALLAGVGGYLDAYTFVGHRVFANAQTGNVVLLAIDASSSHWRAAALRLAPVAAFVAGVVAVEVLESMRQRPAFRRPVRIALAVEVVVLAAVAALPGGSHQLATTVPVAFVAAIQFSTLKVLGDTPYTTLLISGNLRGSTAAAYRWLVKRESTAERTAWRLAGVVGAFAVGAVVGGWCTHEFGGAAAAVASGALLVVLVWLIYETRRIEQATVNVPPGEASPIDRPGIGPGRVSGGG